MGRQGGPQILSVGLNNERYCRKHGVLLHELGHALGFWHEQTRIDRDNYLTILWDNIKPAAVRQFQKYTHETDSLGVAYDFDSIMHYSRYVSFELQLMHFKVWFMYTISTWFCLHVVQHQP